MFVLTIGSSSCSVLASAWALRTCRKYPSKIAKFHLQIVENRLEFQSKISPRVRREQRSLRVRKDRQQPPADQPLVKVLGVDHAHLRALPMRSEHPELAGPPKRCLGALDTVSWPWIPVLGSLEPPRRDGENAQKTGIFGEKMGEIRSFSSLLLSA